MSPRQLISTNPARNYEEIGRVPVSSNEDIDQAVQNARNAFPAWAALGVEERLEYIAKFREIFKGSLQEVARLQSQEMGKPLHESMNECKGMLNWLKHEIATAADILKPQVIESYPGTEVELHHEPFGVAAVICPWNYPTSQFILGFGQILIAGNTVVLKHSEECALTSQLLSSLMEKAGFPQGVFQVVYGDGSVGEALTKSNVNLIHFTGSSKAGKEIYKTAAEKFIPVTLEMGGSSPAIVYADANIDEVCQSVYVERFSNCGQICCAIKRLFVHDSIYDQVVDGLQAMIRKQVVGDPLDENTTVGPLVAERQVALLQEQVEDAKQRGAKIVTGGKRPEGLKGAYFEPTLIVDAPYESRVIQEEVFGPVLPVIRFSNEAEALRMANDTPYGLSAFVYTANVVKAREVAAKLESGQVSINGCSYFCGPAPFGGYKESGLGRVRGAQGYSCATQTKVVSVPA